MEILLPSISYYCIVHGATIVDNEKWYTIIASKESAAWIRTQEKLLWAETGNSVFDIHSELMLLIKLKWQK
jgi:hypothetical protein